MHVCMYVCMYACMYVCMYVVYVYVRMYTYLNKLRLLLTYKSRLMIVSREANKKKVVRDEQVSLQVALP